MSRAAIALLVLVAGCTVADIPYPDAWAPLPAPSNTDCRQFVGRYADRGEAPDGHASSLSRELFGKKGPWESATSLDVTMPEAGVLDIHVNTSDGGRFSQRFSTKTETLKCDAGRLVLRSKRWVVSDVVSGRETVQVEMHLLPGYLVTHVYEAQTGVVFAVVPIAGESARWYRFARLSS